MELLNIHFYFKSSSSKKKFSCKQNCADCQNLRESNCLCQNIKWNMKCTCTFCQLT